MRNSWELLQKNVKIIVKIHGRERGKGYILLMQKYIEINVVKDNKKNNHWY